MTKLGMMRKYGVAVLAAYGMAALVATNAFAGKPSNKVIYGDDDRLDLYQVQDQALLETARSTVALFESSALSSDPTRGTTRLTTKNYGAYASLCSGERFAEQNLGAFCSGSLVGPDLIMTAGHCVTSDTNCANTKFVFDFALKTEGDVTPSEIPNSNVYGCKKLITRRQDSGRGIDYAIIQIDRRAVDRTPLRLNRTGRLAVGTPLVVIGHPVGLPTKVAGGASVRSLENGYFIANLDTYGGNSGSAVFNANTGEIEGILVRGEQDFISRREPNGTMCRASKVCANNACRGEDSTSVSLVLRFVPEL